MNFTVLADHCGETKLYAGYVSSYTGAGTRPYRRTKLFSG